jgi:hypothetical protein
MGQDGARYRLRVLLEDILGFFLAIAVLTCAGYGVIRVLDAGNLGWLLLGLPIVCVLTIAAVGD